MLNSTRLTFLEIRQHSTKLRIGRIPWRGRKPGPDAAPSDIPFPPRSDFAAACYTGQSPMRSGLLKVGAARSESRTFGQGSDAPRAAQAARLHDRAIRSEPSRRPQRAPADRARLRRVLWQPLSPVRRGRAGAPRLSEDIEFRTALWSARRPQMRRDDHRNAGGGSSVRQMGQAELRRHRPVTKISRWPK